MLLLDRALEMLRWEYSLDDIRTELRSTMIRDDFPTCSYVEEVLTRALEINNFTVLSMLALLSRSVEGDESVCIRLFADGSGRFLGEDDEYLLGFDSIEELYAILIEQRNVTKKLFD